MNVHIYELTRNIMTKYKTNDPYILADELGIIVKYRHFNSLKGMYRAIERVHFIWLNNTLDEITEKIVLMHEIGHFVLHKHLVDSPFHEFSLYDMTRISEREANIFAANMLLSDSDIVELATRGYTSEQAAAEMYVPHQLMLIKIEDMIERGYSFRLSYDIRPEFLGD